jgi:hypothetical protein
MIEQRLTHAGHTRRFIVEHAQREGWVVMEELDSQVLTRTSYRDWHRVEQAVRVQVTRLERDGWNLQPSNR